MSKLKLHCCIYKTYKTLHSADISFTFIFLSLNDKFFQKVVWPRRGLTKVVGTRRKLRPWCQSNYGKLNIRTWLILHTGLFVPWDIYDRYTGPRAGMAWTEQSGCIYTRADGGQMLSFLLPLLQHLSISNWIALNTQKTWPNYSQDWHSEGEKTGGREKESKPKWPQRKMTY